MSSFIRTVTSGSTIQTSYNWITYDGTAKPLEGGVETMRGKLRGLLERAEKDEGWAKGARGEVKEVYRRAVE
jgi:hypothetical protein